MGKHRTADQKRYDNTHAVEAKLRRLSGTMNKLIDEAREANCPDSVVTEVLNAWIAVSNARHAVGRVTTDLLLGYSDDAIVCRADILVEGLGDASMIDDIHDKMARVPKEYEAGQTAVDPYIQNMFGRR